MKLIHAARESRQARRGTRKPGDDLATSAKPGAAATNVIPRVRLMQRSLGNAAFARLISKDDRVVLSRAPGRESNLAEVVTAGPGKLMEEGADVAKLVVSELERLMPGSQASGLGQAIAEALKEMKPSPGESGGTSQLSPDDLAKLLPGLFPPEVDLGQLAAEGVEIGKQVARALANLMPRGQASSIGALVSDALGALQGSPGAAAPSETEDMPGGIGGLLGGAGSPPDLDLGALAIEGLDIGREVVKSLRKLAPEGADLGDLAEEGLRVAKQVVDALGKLAPGGGPEEPSAPDLDLSALGAEGLDVAKVVIDAVGKLVPGSEAAAGPMAPILGEVLAGLAGPSAAAATKLRPAEISSARAYYARRPDLYTPEVIKQIQEKLGVPGTGAMDEATILAVADFQTANPPLKVDGKAGPRTLPVEFPVGLAAKTKVDTYVAGAKKVQTEWAALKTADDRGKALAKIVNERLTAGGTPATKHVVKDIVMAGQFDFATWTLELGKEAFSKDPVTDAEAADIAGTVYHESRHAEQWFMMGQLRAGQGRTAAQIADELGIPDDVAKAAVASPVKKGTIVAVEAQGWYESVYGAGSAHRETVLKDLNKKAVAREKAKEEDKKHHSAATAAALAAAEEAYSKAYDRWADLPEEFDAAFVEDKVQKSFLASP